MNREEIALEYFKKGYNCAQSVLTSFKDELGLDENELLKISCGFGAGMGRLQETCGAVSGAYLLIGLKYGKGINEESSASEKTYSLVQKFDSEFKKLNKTTNCSELLGCNLSTKEGQIYFNENKLVENVCAKCITDSIKILTKI